MSKIKSEYELLVDSLLEEEFSNTSITALVSSSPVASERAEIAYYNILKSEFKERLMIKELDFMKVIENDFNTIKKCFSIPRSIYFSNDLTYFTAVNNGLRQTFLENKNGKIESSFIYNKRMILEIDKNGFKSLSYQANKKKDNLDNYFYSKIYGMKLEQTIKKFFEENVTSDYLKDFSIVENLGISILNKEIMNDIYSNKQIKDIKKKLVELPINPFAIAPFDDLEVLRVITDNSDVSNFLNKLIELKKKKGLKND